MTLAHRLSTIATMQGVTLTSGDAAVHELENIDFEIAPGALLVVLGPSGSCKTTLSNILGGIEPSTAASRICTGRTE